MNAKDQKKIDAEVKQLIARLDKMPTEKDLKSGAANIDKAIARIAALQKTMKGEDA